MTSNRRLIEVAFPLKQTSIDSVHEKNVRHGHISTLHIWPARRPLAACRAALVATLLPDPEDDQERKLILEKLGGRLVQRVRRVRNADGKVEEKIVEETEGGILHWGRESGPDLEWFRQKIRETYGGRAPKVLDPFAGGGSIPLEAMRLGCEVTAVDINPVAWFILKCTLEYPQKLAGQTRPLPDFALRDREFMEAFLKSKGYAGGALIARLVRLGLEKSESNDLPLFKSNSTLSPAPLSPDLNAGLAWHVRAWGRWVLAQARRELARFYPTYADFEPLVETAHKVETRPMQLIPLNEDGTPDIDALNAEFDEAYLKDGRNPRWVAKPAVAYLWARTVTCKNCRATIPLLKTRWLCKKEKKRVVLTMQPNVEKTGVVFGVQSDVSVQGINPSQRKAHDKEIGGGTMSRSGATCPCCGAIMTMEDIRLEGQSGRLGAVMTSIAVDGTKGKEYRSPTEIEKNVIADTETAVVPLFENIPFGLPEEPLASKEALGFRIPLYGFDKWNKIFTPRQLMALGTLVRYTLISREVLRKNNYPQEWIEALGAYLATILSRTVDYMTNLCVWEKGAEEVKHVFMRWALPITWDFAEANPLSSVERFYVGGLNSTFQVIDRLYTSNWETVPAPNVLNQSAIVEVDYKVDLIFTDPPYYDAIPYSDLMDFFYVWLRRSLAGLSPQIENVLKHQLTPKWNHEENDGELIDDASRHGGDSSAAKIAYENGMYRAFSAGFNRLCHDGRLIVVFANKNPSAWETLVASIIKAGFCVTGSWPIASEMPGGLRNLNRASLASSIWLVCKKRPEAARPGWDNRVLDEMRHNIINQLRNFWDAGIRGPDFVWAATGPALEAYSQYPAVKKANQPGQLMTVGEFLRHVRRMVVDFVVGRVLSKDGDAAAAGGLDDVTTYYLLHRNDFGFEDAPAGACILYAISCGLSDKDLVDRYDLLARTGGRNSAEEEELEEVEAGDPRAGSGSTLRLKTWKQRKRPNLGHDPALDGTTAHLPLFPDLEVQAPRAREVPLIDQVHRLMHLWRAGDVNKVNDYLDLRGLRRNQLFQQLLQALIELAPAGSEERALLESISNHIGGQKQSVARLF